MKITRHLASSSFAAPLLAAVLVAAPSLAVPSAMAQMTPPMVKAHIYDENANSRKDITAALAKAKREHKRVLVDFGGDWCGDCQVLDIYFHRAPNQQLLEKNYVLVHVPVGDSNDKNIDLRRQYGILKQGVPALAVLDANGKIVYTQSTTEFSTMRSMNPSTVTDFLNKWKA